VDSHAAEAGGRGGGLTSPRRDPTSTYAFERQNIAKMRIPNTVAPTHTGARARKPFGAATSVSATTSDAPVARTSAADALRILWVLFQQTAHQSLTPEAPCRRDRGAHGAAAAASSHLC